MTFGDLEELQQKHAIKELFNMAITQSYMGLLPMDEYIETFVELGGIKNG